MTGERHVVLGAGPLGFAVATQLREAGRAVRVVTRSGQAAVPDEVESVAADLTDSQAASAAFEGAAVVYHCASPPYADWARLVPPLMEGAIAGAASAGARLVYGDNLYCYGPVSGPLTEDLPYRAAGPNAQARGAAAERLMDGTVEASIGRASDFFGPRVLFSAMGDRVFPAALAGKPAKLLPSADTPHTYTYVEDFAAALILLGERDEAQGQVWHVPSAEAVTTRRLVETIFEQAGHPARIQVAPKALVRALGLVNGTMKALGERLYQTEQPFVVDHSKYQAAFGTEPTPTAEAVKQTLDWYRAR